MTCGCTLNGHLVELRSRHLRKTTVFTCNHKGLLPTTRSQRTRARRSKQSLCLMPLALHVDCCSVHKRYGCPSQIGSSPQAGLVATSPPPCGGSPMLQSGGQKHKGPTNGPRGCITRAISGVPDTSEQGTKSIVQMFVFFLGGVNHSFAKKPKFDFVVCHSRSHIKKSACCTTKKADSPFL